MPESECWSIAKVTNELSLMQLMSRLICETLNDSSVLSLKAAHSANKRDKLASSTLSIHSLYAAKWKLLLTSLFGDISHINFYLESDICAPFRSVMLCDKGRLKCVWKYSAVFSLLLLAYTAKLKEPVLTWNQSESDLWIHTHSWLKLPTGPWKRKSLTLIWIWLITCSRSSS